MSSQPTRLASPPLRSFMLASLSAAALLGMTACNTASGRIARPTIRADATVANGFDVQFSSLGYALDAEVEYESVEVAVGATFYAADSDDDSALGRKLSRAELVIGSVTVEEFDVIEVAGGGRFYFGGHPMLQPFIGVHAVGSYIEEIEGIDGGTQLGLRTGGGLEFAITDNVFFDVAVDYTLPLIAAESENLGGFTVESELTGWAVRVGFGFVF